MLVKTRKNIKNRQWFSKLFYTRVFKSFFFMLKETQLFKFNYKSKWLDNHLFISLKLAQIVVETTFEKRITYVEIIDLITHNRKWIEWIVNDIIARHYTTNNDKIVFNSLSIIPVSGKVTMNYYMDEKEVFSEEIKHPYPKLDLSIFDLKNEKVVEKRLWTLFEQSKKYLSEVYEGHILTFKDFKKKKYSLTHSVKKFYAMDILLHHHKGVIDEYKSVQRFLNAYFLSDDKRKRIKPFNISSSRTTKKKK